MELEDECLKRALSNEHEDLGRSGPKETAGVSQYNEGEDWDSRDNRMVVVVHEFVGKRELEPEEPGKGHHGDSDRSVPDHHEPWFLWPSQLLDFDVGVRAKHTTVDDVKIQRHTERPLFGRPLNAEDSLEDYEYLLHDPSLLHESSDQDSRDDNFRQQECGFVVVLVSNEHGRKDDHVPPRDQGCKVVEGVVGVHGVREDDREQIESDHDHGDTLETELVLLVIWRA